MTPYLVQLRHWIFVKDYEFLSFVKDMGKTMGNKINKNFISKKSQNLSDHTKNLPTLKRSLKIATKKAIQKTTEATGDLIGNNIANKITKISRNLPQNSSEIVESEGEKIGFDR